jgi:hypothetical protein
MVRKDFGGSAIGRATVSEAGGCGVETHPPRVDERKRGGSSIGRATAS